MPVFRGESTWVRRKGACVHRLGVIDAEAYMQERENQEQDNGNIEECCLLFETRPAVNSKSPYPRYVRSQG